MKTELLVTSLFLSCTIISFAQVQQNESHYYKNDLGFNTTFISQGIFNASSTPITFMYKKYKHDNEALRFGVSGNAVTSFNSSLFSSGGYTTTSKGNVSISFGRERQINISPKWIWYYGADVVSSYSDNNTQYFYYGLTNSDSKNSSIGLGVKSFFGFRYNINDRLYLSAEASILLYYAYTRELDHNFDNNNIYQVALDKKGLNATFSSNPASGIFVFYKF